uniref:NADH-ubiquinone oxidoreductase chain 4 n=1 Tax=Cyclophorus martensianus TaxID=494924 RepID=A0A4P8VUF0_9CAEN|nr:NADH dehydrogenase subunit 4 [Cyclophorus martensianus]
MKITKLLSLILLNFLMMFLIKIKYHWYISFWALCLSVLLSMLQIWTPSFEFLLLNNWLFKDCLSSLLVVLCFWITALMFLASQLAVKINMSNISLFSLFVLSLNFFLIASFTFSSSVMFYFMFESSLLPTLMLILGWGYQPERLQAGMYMMLYTITSSLPLLLFILWFSSKVMSPNFFFMSILSSYFLSSLNVWLENILMTMIFLAFLVKLPMYSVHLWLPKAHVEAPVSGSMILAAILLKLGSYGMFRMSMFCSLKPTLVIWILISLSMLGGFISALVCFRQTDLKSFIAYSSIGHMSLLVAGILSWSSWGWSSCFLVMISHGFSSSGLFSAANLIYESSHTRSLFLLKGMMSIWPTFSLCWFLLCSLSMACPPSINLLGEIFAFPTIMFLSGLLIIPLSLMSFFTTLYSMYLFLATEHGMSSKFLNSFSYLKKIHYMLPLMHWLPANFIIFKAELLMF